MNPKKQAKLEQAGWKTGTVQEFLGLTIAETQFIETKLALAVALKNQRLESHLTQAELAKRLKSSQSRVAKMESGDPSVSTDLLLRSLFELGVNSEDVARVIAKT